MQGRKSILHFGVARDEFGELMRGEKTRFGCIFMQAFERELIGQGNRRPGSGPRQPRGSGHNRHHRHPQTRHYYQRGDRKLPRQRHHRGSGKHSVTYSLLCYWQYKQWCIGGGYTRIYAVHQPPDFF